MSIVLHQFNFSHFNEKARWALAYKKVNHERQSYLPGPHIPQIKKLSGQRSTPVLDWQGEIIAGSAAIIDKLESEIADNPLYPDDEVMKQKALEIQAFYDNEVGPATRTVLFSRMLDHGSYITGMFGKGKSLPVRFLYRATFPLAKGLIAKGNGVYPENVTRCLDVTARALDNLAEKTGPTGYHVGDTFTVADLTAASLFAPLANANHPDMKRPEPIPESVRELLANYEDHPAIAWVNRQYELHRP